MSDYVRNKQVLYPVKKKNCQKNLTVVMPMILKIGFQLGVNLPQKDLQIIVAQENAIIILLTNLAVLMVKKLVILVGRDF